MKLAGVVAVGAFVATAAFAQGPGSGPGQGYGPGPGKGPGWVFNADNTRGWPMMSREERAQHRSKMLSMRTYEECVAYLEEHRRLMESRARERGRPGPAAPAQDMCVRMREAGRIS
ncbi:MAG TPA: hypothetical protein VM489_00865 [Burkholderiales bacterium]|nr:hypothetical protein [Burkholderiales bacterium]